jgi:hypothetical protein
MPLYSSKAKVDCLGKKGTLILSNQNGIHRGLAQEPDKTRVALVFNFMVVSRWSYLHNTSRKYITYSKEMYAG